MGKKLPELLNEIESETYSMDFKDSVLKINQLYFDGLIEDVTTRNLEIWKQQSKVLNALLEGVRLTVSGFYRNRGDIPFSKVRENILPHDSIIVKYGSEGESKNRHLESQEEDIHNCVKMSEEILRRKNIEVIIPVASGGFETSLLIADYLDINKIFPIRYSRLCKKDYEPLIPQQMPSVETLKIKNKNILLVDDVLSSGETISRSSKWIEKYYNPKKIFVAAVEGGNDNTLEEDNFEICEGSQYLYSQIH